MKLKKIIRGANYVLEINDSNYYAANLIAACLFSLEHIEEAYEVLNSMKHPTY